MAGLGKTGSFVTDAPIARNDVGNAMAQVEDSGFKYRAEQYLKQKDKATAAAEQDKEMFKDIPKPEFTRDADKNEFQRRAAEAGVNNIAENAKLFKSGQISWSEFNKRKANAVNQLTYMNEGAKRTEAFYTDAAKRIAEGKVHPTFADKLMQQGEAIDNGRISIKFNPDGTAHAYLVGQDGKEVLHNEPLNSWGAGFNTGPVNVDINSMDKDFVTANPMPKTESYKGDTRIGVTSISPQIINNIASEVKSRMGNPDIVAQVASELYKKPIERVTDAKILQEVEQKMKNDLTNSYSKSVEKDRDNDYYFRRQQYADGKAEEKLKNAPVDVKLADTTFSEDLQDTRDKDGKLVKRVVSKDNIYENGLNFTKPISIINSGGGKSGMDNMSVNSAFLDKDGRVIVTGTLIDKKGESVKNEDGTITYAGTNKAFTRKASEKTIAAMAKQAGYSNTEAFKKELKDKNPQYYEDTKTNATREEYDNARGNGNTKKSISYTDVTETNKGTIGFKDGQWYYVKTGKIAQ